MTAKCSSCGQDIIWTITEAGKRAPFDAKPAGKVTFLARNPDGSDTPISKQRDHYISHFATCPKAAQHRTKAPKSTRPPKAEA